MKASEIYVAAARNVADKFGTASCVAVHDLSPVGKRQWAHAQEYARLFSPCDTHTSVPCLAYSNALRLENIEKMELHNFRVLALCFMAAIAEDEERSANRISR